MGLQLSITCASLSIFDVARIFRRVGKLYGESAKFAKPNWHSGPPHTFLLTVNVQNNQNIRASQTMLQFFQRSILYARPNISSPTLWCSIVNGTTLTIPRSSIAQTSLLHLPREARFVRLEDKYTVESRNVLETSQSHSGTKQGNRVHTKWMITQDGIQSARSHYSRFFRSVSHPSPLIVHVLRGKPLHLWSQLCFRAKYVSVENLKMSGRLLWQKRHPFRIPESTNAQTKAYISLPLPLFLQRSPPPGVPYQRTLPSNPWTSWHSFVPVRASNTSSPCNIQSIYNLEPLQHGNIYPWFLRALTSEQKFDAIHDILQDEHCMFGAQFSCVPPHIVWRVCKDKV